MPVSNHYDVLGLSPTATTHEIGQAYKRLALTHHPDQGGSIQAFQKLQDARETLTNKDKRFIYDLTNGFKQPVMQPQPTPPQTQRRPSTYTPQATPQQLSGHHSVTYPGGTTYFGNFERGKPNGSGFMHMSDGTLYDGTFRDGVPVGQHLITFPDKTTYRGEVVDGQPHGLGQIHYTDNTSITGTFAHGQLVDGRGIIDYPNGQRYEGDMKNGKAEGKGQLRESMLGRVIKKGTFKNGEYVRRYGKA